MRYIRTSDALTVNDQPMTVREVIAYHVNTDQKFNSDGPGLRASVRVDQAITASQGCDCVALKDEDWQLLCAVIEQPSSGYLLRPARALQMFFDAIVGASEERPTEQARAAE